MANKSLIPQFPNAAQVFFRKFSASTPNRQIPPPASGFARPAGTHFPGPAGKRNLAGLAILYNRALLQDEPAEEANGPDLHDSAGSTGSHFSHPRTGQFFHREHGR